MHDSRYPLGDSTLRANGVDLALRVSLGLRNTSSKLVLAESCTSGMVAARLGSVPGISDVFCGSLVTYRESAKAKWLGVPETLIRDYSAECQPVSEALMVHSLQRTDEATIAAAVTGHLGPNAPPEKDGKIFIAVGVRENDIIRPVVAVTQQLKTTERYSRQLEAANVVLYSLVNVLEGRLEDRPAS